MSYRLTRRVLTFLLPALLAGAAYGQEAPAPPSPPSSQQEMADAFAGLPSKYQDWLRSVIGLMSQRELEYFLALREDYRRDAFMDAFWKPRDPDRATAANELRERWEQYRSASGGFAYGDPRFLLYLLNGPPGGWSLPDGRPVARCFSRSKELEIWFYGDSERTTRRFAVVFVRNAASQPYEVYLPGDPLRPQQRTGGLPTQDIRQLCAEELLGYAVSEMRRMGGYPQLVEKLLAPPLPSPEWLANFSASAADLPAGAETFEMGAELAFPARNQSRTAVQVILTVPREAAPGRRFDDDGDGQGELFHDFLLVGEIIRDGRLFESFRYRFEGPTSEESSVIPLGFTRYLRPGPAALRILLEDVFGNRYARVVREVEVPSPDGLPSVSGGFPESAGRPSGPSLRLVPPSANVVAGKVRFRASAQGELEKVAFFLDDQQVLSKRRPPYSVELDLGEGAEPHRVRVVGYLGGQEVATDQIWLNQGAQRFRVRLIEPRAGGIYPGSVTARVEVDTPGGGGLDRVEIYVNDRQAATLDEPPFARSLRLSGSEPAVVRAVAYLSDGSSTEDAVIVNASPFTETVEVRLVEIPVLVTNESGQPITGLSQEQFRVFDGGTPQVVERFEEASGAPIHAALLLDRSVSMAPHLERVSEAALAFVSQASRTPDDRVAVFSFADQLAVDAGFDGNTGQAERALAGLVAHGGTALYDSVVQALNNFADVTTGTSALVVFSDGRDESSRLTFEQTLETARRAGVTVYAVGLEEAFPEKEARRVLEDLTAETGGRAYFLAGLDGLSGVYDAILAELGSRYLLAYPPGSPAGAGYRELRVEVDVKGARVRARRGYYSR